MSQPVEAARQLPIAVEVRIAAAVVQNDWTTAETQDVAAALRTKLHETLADRFRHWLFRQSEIERRGLRLEVRPGLGDSSVMTLVGVGRIGARDLTESPAWLAPGERSTRGFPPPEAAKSDLARHLTSVVLADRRNVERVGAWLRTTVPIAPEGRWMEDQAADKLLIALSLPMTEFDSLRNSLFRVAARAPDGHAESVEAAGMDLPVPYPPDADSPAFEGLAALAERRIVGTTRMEIDAAQRQRLRELRLGPVYLVEEREPTLFQPDDWVDR